MLKYKLVLNTLFMVTALGFMANANAGKVKGDPCAPDANNMVEVSVRGSCSSIQAAIDATVASGNASTGTMVTINIAPGTYIESLILAGTAPDPLVKKGYITLQGAGIDETIINIDFDRLTGSVGPGLNIALIENVEVKGITFIGGRNGQIDDRSSTVNGIFSNVTFENNRFQDFDRSVFLNCASSPDRQLSTDLFVLNNIFENIYAGVNVCNVNPVVVTGNTITNFRGPGIYVECYQDVHPGRECIVEDNIINGGANGSFNTGIYVYTPSATSINPGEIVVSRNQVSSCRTGLQSPDYGPALFSENIITSNTNDLYIKAMSNTSVYMYNIFDTTSLGVAPTNNFINKKSDGTSW